MTSPAIPHLENPVDLDLPIFVYGAFKPGELAYTQLKDLIVGEPVSAYADGALRLRDGLPLYDPQGPGRVKGYVLHFHLEVRKEAYDKVCAFEPKQIYGWLVITLPTGRANILQGKTLGRGRAVPLEASEWSFRLDPVFDYGLREVERFVRELADEPFKSAPPEYFEWPRFFRLQMAYLLLWSAIERFCTYAYGPALGPTARIKALGSDQRFKDGVAKHLAELLRVADSRNPRTEETLDPNRPEKAAMAFYQVRSNLAHRGKGAYADGEIVRKSLRYLLAIFEEMLQAGQAQKSSVP